MSFHWVIPLIAAIANGCLAFVVLRKNPSDALNRTFAALSLGLLCWDLNIFVLYAAEEPTTALYWSSVFRFGTMLCPALAAHVALVCAGTRARWVRALVGVSYLLSLILLFGNATGTLVSGVRTVEWGFYPIGTRLYVLFAVSQVYTLVLALGLLIYVLLHGESPRKRQQAKFWILGLVVAMPLSMTNVAALAGVPIYPLGTLGNVMFSGIVSYAIIRHRLMDIDIVITRWGSYLFVSVILIVPVFGIMLWMQEQAFGHVHPDVSIASLSLLLLVAILFPELRRRVETRIELSFFREQHEYRNALAEFADRIVRIIERDKLLEVMSRTLEDILRPDRLGIFLRDEKGHQQLQVHRGEPAAVTMLESGSPLVRWFARRTDLALLDELNDTESPTAAGAADTLRANGWELCLPLQVTGRLSGIVVLGRKRSREIYSAQDILLLRAIATQAAIALENARLYEELQKSRDIIRRTDRMSALGTLAAGIAHEIRNPLVSIQTFFQLAPERLHDEEFVTSFLRLTESEVKRIADLVSELLTFARPHEQSIQEVDLEETVDRVLRLLAPQANRHGVRLQREGTGTALMVRAHADRLKQVLINVVLNGIQATPTGGKVTVATAPVERGRERFAQIEVRDTGAGIAAENQEAIFDPFFTTKEKGTGLGLSIAHEIVRGHGGFITVESHEGEGSCFRIQLPAHSEETGPLSSSEVIGAVGAEAGPDGEQGDWTQPVRGVAVGRGE